MCHAENTVSKWSDVLYKMTPEPATETWLQLEQDWKKETSQEIIALVKRRMDKIWTKVEMEKEMDYK